MRVLTLVWTLLDRTPKAVKPDPFGGIRDPQQYSSRDGLESVTAVNCPP